jgi:hypothetical protein
MTLLIKQGSSQVHSRVGGLGSIQVTADTYGHCLRVRIENGSVGWMIRPTRFLLPRPFEGNRWSSTRIDKRLNSEED